MTAVTAGRRARLDRAAHGRAAHAAGACAQARWHRAALLALLAATALLYLVGLSRSGWANDFYAAAVQAGTKSWKAFFFGSFDASSFITVDKTPGSLWVMELSARVFGLNSWSMLVPQALEGVASVAVLYAAVRRWHGPAAGLLAAAALAVTPVAALMFRYNNPDALLTLLMTAGAYAMVRAIESGRTRWLVLAGSLLGFGFLTKMLQAFLVLPAFGLAYLVTGPRPVLARIGQLAAALAAVLVSAGWWVAAVMLTPAADRPYIGGSTNNSILQLALGYNGLGRLSGNETGSVGFTGGRGGGPAFSGASGLLRLFGSSFGGQISWLLPAAVIAVGGLSWLWWRARRGGQAALAPPPGAADPTAPTAPDPQLAFQPRRHRDLAAVLLWGGWLAVTAAVFSLMQGIIHPYYGVALAPAIAALVGIGAIRLWQAADGWPARGLLAAGIAATAIWSYVLLERTPGWLPWLRYGVLVIGLGAAAAVLIADRLGALPGPSRGATGRRAAAGLIVAAAVTASLAGPVAYSLDTAATAHAGALPSAGPAVTAGFGGGPGFGAGPGAGGQRPPTGGIGGFGGFAGRPPGAGSGSGLGTGSASGSGSAQPGAGLGRVRGGAGLPGGAGGGPGGGLAGSTVVSSALIRLLEQQASGYTWAAATVSSTSAAPLQLATRLPVMSVGGFNGTDQAPSLAAFEKLVAVHKIRFFVGANGASFGGGSGAGRAITSWVTAHFRSQTVGGYVVYDLTQPRAS